MEVTKDNFEQVLPLVQESIHGADYIAFDIEFSGANTLQLCDEHNEYDSPEDRYRKIKDVVREYTAIQFGVCAFKWDQSSQKYLARPFNFYTYPISQERLRDSVQKF